MTYFASLFHKRLLSKRLRGLASLSHDRRSGDVPGVICANCLEEISADPALTDDALTDEHVVPKAWYPATTPATIQRWTVPSHRRCNQKNGLDEEYALQSFATIVDPETPATAGIWPTVLRGVQPQSGRNARDAKKRAESYRRLMARTAPIGSLTRDQLQHAYRSLTNAEGAEMVIFVDSARVDRVLEKIVRCAIYKLRGAPPPAIAKVRAQIVPHDLLLATAGEMAGYLRWHDLGPGCKIGEASTSDSGARGEIVHLLLWESVYVQGIALWQLPGWAILAKPLVL